MGYNRALSSTRVAHVRRDQERGTQSYQQPMGKLDDELGEPLQVAVK